MPFGASKRKSKRLFLDADLHGSEIVFRKVLSAATFYEAGALRIGGDLTAKTITPIVQQIVAPRRQQGVKHRTTQNHDPLRHVLMED